MSSHHTSPTDQQSFSMTFLTSHALQEPLRKIQLFSSLLAEDRQSQLSDEAIIYLEKIMTSVKRMQHITDSLTSYRQLSGHNGTVADFETVDLCLIIKEIVNEFADTIRLTAASIKIGNLPVVNGRPEQLSILFTNLITNALLYVKPGIPPQVKISSSLVWEDKKEYYKIEVADSGLGFQQGDAQRIFEPFQRLHSRDKYEGGGMGLSICREIAHLHGGLITVRSVLGEGATFSVFIPVNR